MTASMTSDPINCVVMTEELGALSGDIIFSYPFRHKDNYHKLLCAYAETSTWFTVDGGLIPPTFSLHDVTDIITLISDRRDDMTDNVIPVTVDAILDCTESGSYRHLHPVDNDHFDNKMKSLKDDDQAVTNSPFYNNYHGWSD